MGVKVLNIKDNGLGMFITIWFDIMNSIHAKISQPNFWTTKAVKYMAGVC